MEPTIKSSPKDVFIHLLAIITLYISAVSFTALLFQFVDLAFPDRLVDFYPRVSGTLRWALASLVIIFPVYVWLAWTLAKEVTATPAKRELRVRKGLLYFTLFVAAIIIIGDLVALVYNFLGGDLSVRFAFKILAVFFVASAVFGYYLWNLRAETMASRDPRAKLFVWGTVGIVVVAIIAGFVVAGSPFAERMRRFDERRVGDLQTIQWQVVNYWQRKDKLPVAINELRDDISGFIPPVDPESGSAYEYRATEKLKFELCADFKTSSAETERLIPKAAYPAYLVSESSQTPENWSHGTGRVCFERTIDPELYKLSKSVP